MKFILLDDEQLALENLDYVCRQAYPDCETFLFAKSSEALSFLKDNEIDVILSDIEMPGMDGISFAKKVKEVRSETNIIFVTAYSDYAYDAFAQRASGYLLKPVKAADIKKEIENLRYPIKKENGKKLKVVCFGRFEAYCGDELIHFARTAEKEILAYLIDLRGGGANTNEICGILWEDYAVSLKNRNYFRVLYNGLIKTLNKYGCRDALIKKTNYFAIDISKVDCDYYDFLNGKMDAINSYMGEYMSQYSWAEMTIGDLDSIYSEYIKNRLKK